ncbi:MAG: NAD-dependent epimerase/dehydratase family protein [Candidatus Eisenbacteria bacterium]|nr:NAD-dependent epimerase/dehydratase family protein [Candidatus Eisenbacteria bacterium]
MARALVTGGTGFVGGALAMELKRSGYELDALVRPAGKRALLESLGARLVPGDLSDRKALEEAVRHAHVVHHVAAVVRARDPREFERSNVEGTRLLLEVCASRPGGAPRVVLVSSLAAAGPSPDGRPLTEDDTPHPVTAYGRSKLAQERLAGEFRDRVPVIVVRPPVVYGPRDTGVLVLFRMAMRGFSPLLVGGTERSCMIHVDDLAAALRLAGEKGPPGAVYFATDGTDHHTFEMAKAIAKVLGRRTLPLPAPLVVARAVARVNRWLTPRDLTPVLDPDKVIDLSQRFWVCSDARARRELGYSSRWDLQTGLEQTAKWYRDEGWL